MLAALPREQVRALYPDAAAFADRTGRGPRRPGELREVLREVRARGYALEDGEVTLGLGSVGVAVLDHVGWPIAAVAVTYASDGAQDAAALAALVAPTARELGRRIRGARPRTRVPANRAKWARILAATSALSASVSSCSSPKPNSSVAGVAVAL